MKVQIVEKPLKLTYPRISPYNGVLDYLRSKQAVTQVQATQYVTDKARHTPNVELVAACRTFDSTEEALRNKREQYKEERKKLDLQWEDLRQKELELKNTFESMTNFIISNEAKRTRAKQRYIEESKLLKKRTADIERLKNKLAYLEQVKEEMDYQLSKHKFYEKYLDSMTEHSTDFKNALDVVDRYESLTATKQELGERQNKSLETLEAAKLTMSRLADDYRLRILGLNNVVASLNARYQEATTKAMHWESTVWSIKDKAFERYQEMLAVKQASYNIFKMMSRRKEDRVKINDEDVETQLVYIKRALRELKLVRHEAQQQAQVTASSVKGQTSKVT